MTEVLPGLNPDVRARLSLWYQTINGDEFLRAAEAGLLWLKVNQAVVNSLNVFPVPDGDTGTNMVLTMQSAWESIRKLEGSGVGVIANSLADGALEGARGNSGVILSQLWRGLARGLANLEVIDVNSMAAALAEARDTAYRGVVRPVEGTILTVASDVAKEAEAARLEGTNSVLIMLERIVESAGESVERTPELLPVLREAGVVDSGGKGLYFILEGMLRSVYGQPLDQTEFIVEPLTSLQLDNAAESIEPGQDWEVVVDFRPDATLELEPFYNRLEEMGTSIQVGEGNGTYRMHIHVPDTTQYQPIEYVQTLGTVTNVAIENLMDQMEAQANRQTTDLELFEAKEDQIAAVAVSPGHGIGSVMASLGAAALVEGGQTMNPSTNEILQSFEGLSSKKIVVLPNNKNIRMAAEQAAAKSKKEVALIPSTTIPQGIAAMIQFDPDGEFLQIVEAMEAALSYVNTLEITRATRSVELDGVPVAEGQYICLLNDRLVAAHDDLKAVLLEGLAEAPVSDSELITFYRGNELSLEVAERLVEEVRNKYPSIDFENVRGDQPHYQLILSIE